MNARALPLLFVLSACGEGYVTNFEILGVPVEFERPYAYLATQDTKDALEAEMRGAMGFWGLSRGDLAGWRIVFVYQLDDCTEHVANGYRGCTNGLEKKITLKEPAGYCMEASALAHELGHVALPFGDPEHWSEKWQQVRGMWNSVILPKAWGRCRSAWEQLDPVAWWGP